MPEENKVENESNIDIKGTIEKFIKADEPELSQEEAIMKYGERKNKVKSSNNSNNDEDMESNTEEQEHLKRVKQELLASLERVKVLEKKIFGEESKFNNKKELKVTEKGEQLRGRKIESNTQNIEKEINQHERE